MCNLEGITDESSGIKGMCKAGKEIQAELQSTSRNSGRKIK